MSDYLLKQTMENAKKQTRSGEILEILRDIKELLARQQFELRETQEKTVTESTKSTRLLEAVVNILHGMGDQKSNTKSTVS